MIKKLEKHIIGENAPGMVSSMVAPTAEQQVDKINELVDAVNELQKHEEQHLDLLTELNEMRLHQNKEPAENVRPPYMQNKRLRKALGIAQSALVKLANDAYDMDEHIYIDKILNRIESITKGGDNE